jgi:hypothetical protein
MKYATLFLWVSVSLCPPSIARAQPVDHSAFDAILNATVKGDRIDYNEIKNSHLARLTAYLDTLAKPDPANLPRSDQLAFYINLYNATMIRTIVDRLKPNYTPAENDYKVFKEPLVRLNGKTISLNDLENTIIRPTFKDPRIHVALVCGARSCPPILPRAYKADDLDATLDQNMRNFVADRFRNPIDDRTRTLKLSRIFDWYADDFGGKQGVSAYISKYTGTDYRDWKVEFVDYSWDLNITK